MKTFFSPKILIFFLSIVLISFACGSDDDNGTNNFIVINGTTYELSRGFLEPFGGNGNGSFDWDVTLASSGLTYNNINEEFTGTGDAIYLDLNSDSDTGLTTGTYNFSSSRNAFTLVDGTVFEQVNFQAATGSIFDVTAGTVDITATGNDVTIEFNLTISNTTTVTGRWSGTLQPI